MRRVIDRALAVRNRLLMSPAFHRWSTKTPIVRRFAAKEARAAFDLVAGFVYSQILYACVTLGVFEALKDGPQDCAALASRLGLTPEAAKRLALAAVSLRLLETRGPDRFGLGPLGAAVMANPGVLKMIEHHQVFYDDLRDPVALLRGEAGETQLSRFWPYAMADGQGALADEAIADYTALMAGSQSLVAEVILDAYALKPHRCLLDIGGGDGTFLSAVAKRAPHLNLMLFDLPPVAARAAGRLASEGLGNRAQVFGGNFQSDAIPTGADIVSLVRIIHDHDDAIVNALLAAVHRALPPGGRLLIAEPMSGTPGAEPVGDAYFGFYLMAMGSGRPRTAAEIIAMAKAAGFASARQSKTRMPLQASLVVANA